MNESVNIGGTYVEDGGITEIGRAEGALRRSEDKYRRLVESLGREYLFYAHDTNGIFYYVSPSITDMLGYEMEEFIAHYSTYLTDNPLNDDVAKKTEECIRGIKHPPYLVEIHHRSGTPRLLEVTETPVFDDEGKVVAVEGIAHDVTERRKIDEALREGEERYRTLVANIPGTTYRCACDEHWTMEFFSDAVETLSGYPCSDFLQNSVRSYASIIHPEDVQRVEDTVMQCVDSRSPFTIEYRIIHADGKPRWVYEKGQGVFDNDGQLSYLAGVIVDITERKRAEEELWESQALLQAAMDQSQAGIAIADAPDGKLRYVNASGLGMREATHEDLVDGVGIEQYVSSWQILHFDGTPFRDDEVPLARAIMCGETCSAEFILRTEDGKDRIVLANAAPLRNDAGEVTAAVVVFVDIGERRKAEERQRTHMRFLENMERIDRVIRLAGNLEQMKRGVLEEVRNILECDRVWLLHPCDPDTSSWLVFLECTHPDYPATLERNDMVAISPEVAQVFQEALESDGPVAYDPESGRVVPDGARAISVQSQLLMAIYPRVGKPWCFGMHQCSHARVWSEDEVRLIEVVGHRLEDALSTMLYSEDLRESEERFRAAFDSAQDCVLIWDKDYNYLYANQAAIDHVGATEDTVIGKNIRDGLGHVPDFMHLWMSRVDQVFETGERLRVTDEQEMQGRLYYTDSILAPTKDAHGNVQSVCVVYRDVTELIRAEEELASTHQQLQNIFDHSLQIAIIASTPDGVISVFNAGAERMLGYTAEEMIGKHTTLKFHLESEVIARGKELSEEYGRPIEGPDILFVQPELGGYGEREWTYVRKDGTHITVNQIVTILRDKKGEVTGIVGFAQDITERKMAEEELRNLRNYLSNIINSMPSVLIGVDAQGNVTQWNREARRATGVPSADAVGHPLDKAFPSLASEMKRVLEAMESRETLSSSGQARQKDGETRYEDVTIYPLVANGVEGAVIRVDDVTERVRLEELMIQSEKMLSVGGLAAGMAHEINNPLAGMMQTANVMANRLANLELPANQRAAEEAGTTVEAIRLFMEARDIPRMIATVNESGQRVADIVENMLSFARKSDAEMQHHDIADLVDRTLELAATDYDLRRDYDFKMIAMTREYEENLPSVPCERAKIQQVLLNILRNGAQAMQEGKTEKPQFIARTRFNDERNMVCIEIEDNGPGMDEETRKRVFEPFFTTKPAGVGTGLGLSVSYFIITENHNGEMAVESQPGSGSNFIVRLPIRREPA